LAINLLNPGWWADLYTPAVTLHQQSEDRNSIVTLVGCADGTIQQFADLAADTGGPIECQVCGNASTFGDFRAAKQLEDVFVDCDGAATDDGITVTLLADNWSTAILQEILTGARSNSRLPMSNPADYGIFNVNAALDFFWSGPGLLYGCELTALLVPVSVTRFAPQPTSHGLQGYHSVREVRPLVQGSGTCVIAAECEFGSFSLSAALTGALQKLYLPCPPNKGMLYGWTVIGNPVRVYEPDFEVLVKAWGSDSPFQIVRPFGEQGSAGGMV
jgi:hypothetical protein